MATFLNNDDVIWFKHVVADQNTLALLMQLQAGTKLKLEIEGRRGDWERMNVGKDGRPSYGLRPASSMVEFWKTMKSRRGEVLEFKIVDPRDNYLEAVEKTLSEWESDEDEKAFHDL